MVKPPKSMEPESFKYIEKDGQRNAGKAFEDDSFRNYMARKISLQRKQFGLALPPDPRTINQQQQKQQPSPATTHNVHIADKHDSYEHNHSIQLEQLKENHTKYNTNCNSVSTIDHPIAVDTSDRKRKRALVTENQSDFHNIRQSYQRHLDGQQPQRENQIQIINNDILEHRQTSPSNFRQDITSDVGECSVQVEKCVNGPLHDNIDTNGNNIRNNLELRNNLEEMSDRTGSVLLQTINQQSSSTQKRRPSLSCFKKSKPVSSSLSCSVIQYNNVRSVQFASPAVSKEFHYDNGETCENDRSFDRKSLRRKRKKKEKKNRKKQKLLQQSNDLGTGIGFFSNVLKQLQKKHGRIKTTKYDTKEESRRQQKRKIKSPIFSLGMNLDNIFDNDDFEHHHADFESSDENDNDDDDNVIDNRNNLDDETILDHSNGHLMLRNDTEIQKRNDTKPHQDDNSNTAIATNSTSPPVTISNDEEKILCTSEPAILSIENDNYTYSPSDEACEIDAHKSDRCICDEFADIHDSYRSDDFTSESPGIQAETEEHTPRKNLSLRQMRPDLFLMGVVVMVNGYTNPDVETLQRILHRHGGDLERYETSRVTHIIAEHLSYAKSKMYKSQRRPLPVCYPKWITDCVNAQKLLPAADYIISEMKDTNTTPWKSVATYFNATTSKNSRSTTDCNDLVENNDVANDSPTEGCCITNVLLDAISHSKEDSLLQATNEVIVLDDSDDDNDLHNETHTETSKQRVYLEVTDDDYSDEQIPNKNPNLLETTEIVNCERPYQHSEPKEKKGIDVMEEQVVGLDTPTNSTKDVAVANDEIGIDRPKISRGTHLNGKLRTTGTDPYFLDSFFSASRLSFMGSYKQRTKTSPVKKNMGLGVSDVVTKRYVLHVDMDCFFASVVLRNYPEYQNKPVAIAHAGRKDHSISGGTAVVKGSSSECSTCNYEARKYGIKKGMFLGRAKVLCPDLIVLKYDFEGYEEVSEQVSEILYKHASSFDGFVEQVSCDESYIEMFIPDNCDKSSDAMISEVAEMIRTEIYEVTQCTATVGVGQNKLLSKLATDHVKPNKSFVVVDSRALLRSTKLRDLNGVGYRLERVLNQENLVCVQDIWDLGDDGENVLCRLLGPATGKKLFGFCAGIDDRPVQPAPRKTIGAEVRIE
jgi:nucleotidyltransferase/DNA polymerase involved in DNA repair